jgi:hypothetical protein
MVTGCARDADHAPAEQSVMPVRHPADYSQRQ